MKTPQIISSALLLFVFTLSISAQDWPQFSGPDRNGTSPQENLLRSWPESGPEVLWTAEIGKGFGGPVIKDGKVYLLDRNDDYGDYMRCFDMDNGEELWNYGYEAPMSVEFPGSRSVPSVGDKFVYSCGHNGDLYCFDINTHQAVWNRNIWTDFGGQSAEDSEGGFSGLEGGGRFPVWAIAQCPLIYGDLLIIASQAPEAGVVAYNKVTGDVVWKTASLGRVGFVSPSIAKIDGEDQVIMITASNRSRGGGPQEPSNVVGIDPQNGDVLWTYSNWSCWIPSSLAYDAGDNKILIIGGYRAGAAMIQIEKSGDNYTAAELYKNEDFGEHTKPPLYYKGYFYAQYSTNERRDGLVCMSLDGEIQWKTSRDPLFDKGSMILADGLILSTDGSTKLYLIEPDPSGYKPLASAELLEKGQNWAPIALADGKLLIRDQSKMICVKVAQQ